MPWWSWVVIWVVLVLAMFAMLVLFAIWLFRKLMTVLNAFGGLADQLTLLDAAGEALSDPAFHPAVFADLDELRGKRALRVREKERNRQLRRDARISRGTLLINADYRGMTIPERPHRDQRR